MHHHPLHLSSSLSLSLPSFYYIHLSPPPANLLQLARFSRIFLLSNHPSKPTTNLPQRLSLSLLSSRLHSTPCFPSPFLSLCAFLYPPSQLFFSPFSQQLTSHSSSSFNSRTHTRKEGHTYKLTHFYLPPLSRKSLFHHTPHPLTPHLPFHSQAPLLHPTHPPLPLYTHKHTLHDFPFTFSTPSISLPFLASPPPPSSSSSTLHTFSSPPPPNHTHRQTHG